MNQICFVVGQTRTGKAILCFPLENQQKSLDRDATEFSDDDSFDACAVFDLLALKARRRLGKKSAEYRLYVAIFLRIGSSLILTASTKRRCGQNVRTRSASGDSACA